MIKRKLKIKFKKRFCEYHTSVPIPKGDYCYFCQIAQEDYDRKRKDV